MFRFIYAKLFRINDTPQKIALGLGIGVFSGILPGIGPIAALFMAFVLGVNRAAALLGSLVTNSWLSIVTFALALKLGSRMMGLNWQDAYRNSIEILKNFRWISLFKLSALKIFLPLIIGYFSVALFLGILAYLVTLVTIKIIRH